MLQSTPMLYREHSNDTPACQQHASLPPRTGVQQVIAAVARAYAEAGAGTTITPATILGRDRSVEVAQARHLCAYLLMEDDGLTCTAAARALGRRDHTTILNSRARIAAALIHDDLLRRTIAAARAALAHRPDVGAARHVARRRQEYDALTSAELAEYRYWRLRALRPGIDARGGV